MPGQPGAIEKAENAPASAQIRAPFNLKHPGLYNLAAATQ